MNKYCLVIVLLLGVTLTGVALAQTGAAGYDLTWWTVDGGGHTFSAGGNYTLGGTIGQPDAGPVLTGGSYTLAGGFWGGGAAQYRLYLPWVLRPYWW